MRDVMIGYWTRFATTGDPNGDGAFVWRRYDASSRDEIVLAPQPSTQSGYHSTPTCARRGRSSCDRRRAPKLPCFRFSSERRVTNPPRRSAAPIRRAGSGIRCTGPGARRGRGVRFYAAYRQPTRRPTPDCSRPQPFCSFICPTNALALFAQRQDRVHATVTAWYRTLRRRRWQRRRVRIHPTPAKNGLRADRPGQFLHVDVTVLRLLDGTRAFVQAVLDNYSRKILAYTVASTYDGSHTAILLRQALDELAERGRAVLLSDGGPENRGPDVARVLDGAGVLQLVAQGHVTFSNSMIEAFWRSMKHGFLFQQRLDSIASLTRFVDFYVHEHNAVMPHSAFNGQTPDEAFAATGQHVPALLAEQRRAARGNRLADNRHAHCSACPNGPPPTGLVP
jgi:putative transposase